MKINFFTAVFPYRSAEPFIENELPIVARNVDGITIFPYINDPAAMRRFIPSNCKVILNNQKPYSLNFRDYLLITKLIFSEFFLTSKKKYFLRNIRRWFSLLKSAFSTAKFLSTFPDLDKQTICYSYWMDEWALALTILKAKKKIPCFVFRCGGFDIWDERSPGGYLPFRGIIYKYTSGIYPNSETAAVYLRSKNIYPKKVKCMYWGTSDYGIAPFDPAAPFTLVSSSYVIPLKRVELIVEILKNMNTPVRWIHFGDGEDFEKIKSLAAQELSGKHEFTFTGFIPNQELIQFYKTNVVHLFITTSSTEGLPVSLQEAISFGIPCVATNVGGICEVVDSETGILIPKDFNPKEVAGQIETFIGSDKNTLEFRQGVRAKWLSKFAAEKNYTDFVNEIKSL